MNQTAGLSELLSFAKQHIFALVASLVVVFGVIFVGAFLFERQISDATLWIHSNFGFWGLAISVFFADTFVSPIPPDLVLVVIKKSPMREHWALYVLAFGVISTLAGCMGYFLGRLLSQSRFAYHMDDNVNEKYGKAIKKFGFWTVVIGALTPFPFSITCWAAGYFRLDFKIFLLAVITRIPRFFLYYVIVILGFNLEQLLF